MNGRPALGRLAYLANTKRQRQKQAREASRAYFQAQERRARRRRQVLAGVALFLVIGLVVGSFLSNTPDRDADQTAEKGKAAPDEGMPAEQKIDPTCPPADGSAERRITFAAPPPNCVQRARSYRATVETDVGTFVADLDDERAPKTVNNFVFLARHHFYDGVPFHRVIPGFVVQGGDAEKGDGTGGPGYTVPDELPRAGPYPVGALAMANTGRPNTGGSQFFVVTGDQGTSLPPRYSLFGQVTQGLDVVKKIEADGSSEGTPGVVHKMVKVTITES